VRVIAAWFGLVFALAMPKPGLTQDKATPTQTCGVDNTRMGPYRALAQLSFQAFGRGDTAMAAELARVLEQTWDRGELHGGGKSLSTINSDLAGQIDKAMDVFIKPLTHYAKAAPDVAAAKAAYDAYLEKLKQGDE